MRKLAAGKFQSFSAGSQRKGVVNPFARKVLQAHAFPTDGLRSKCWEEFSGEGMPAMDFVITVCDAAAGEACPLWPGQPITAHWGIEDPAAVSGSDLEKERAFETAFQYLFRRVSAFAALPIKSLDTIRLTAEVRRIGSLAVSTAKTLEAGS